ncbi:MAG: NADPH dehydrogenase NamA [Deferribacterota bacterium]|nr:NADPH dehydrogenase NamA [Deferribacterota bacterium]
MLNILKSFNVNNLTLKNRLVMSPMCMYSASEEGFIEDFHITHYATRAYGGVGTILVEANAVLPEGRITENDLGIWNDKHIAGHTKLVRCIEEGGAVAGIQLAHAGRKAEVRSNIYAPSPIRYSKDYKIPIELTKEDIKNLVKNFKSAFIRAKKCGYKIMEIHAAHGYLLNEFLSPLTNKREDEYGYKSYENRFRLIGEIISEIRNCDDRTPLLIRFSASDYAEGGYTIKDTVIFAKMAKEFGVNIVDVSSGGVVEEQKLNVYPGYQVDFAKAIKEEVDIPTIAVGLITTLEQTEQILGSGYASLVAMGRNLLRYPYFLINKIKEYDVELAENYYPKQYLRSFEIR